MTDSNTRDTTVNAPKSPATDALEKTRDGYRVRLRYGKGLRGRFTIKLKDEAEAEKRAIKLRAMAEQLGRAGHFAEAPLLLKRAAGVASAADFAEALKICDELCGNKGRKSKVAPAPTTFDALAARWTNGELARDYPDHVAVKKTVDLDVSRLEALSRVQVAPGLAFGALPVSSIALAHCKAVMSNLPKTAKRPGTRRHYAQLIHRVLELAVYPCELIPTNPLPRSFMPKIGKPPAFSYLYPNEEAALLSAPANKVPLCYRVLWGFLAREGCRSGEAVRLRIGHEVDLERGAISLDRNKTGEARAWAMDPNVTEALRRWVNLRGAKRGDLVFVDEAGEPLLNDKLAELVRAHLAAAGVDREELHKSGENRGQFRCHDLRATFITLSLANGKTETWVQDRTGHTTSIMINRYRRGARSATELGVGGLAPLDLAIPELLKTAVGGPEGGPSASPLDQPNGRNYTESHDEPKWRNWQTRRTQNPFLAIECRFNPDLRHHEKRPVRASSAPGTEQR